MESRKSRSGSLPRKRVLRRNPTHRPLEERDLRVSLFLAYRGGAFADFPAGLDKDGFAEEALNRIAQWDDAIILEARKPVGLLAVNMMGQHALIRVFWLPWATPRNKLETVIKFIVDHRNDFHLMGISRMENGIPVEKPFFDRLHRSGIVRAIGVSESWDGPVTLYESRRS